MTVDQPKGDSPDDAPIVDLVRPLGEKTINGMVVNMQLLAQAADRIGAGKHEMLTFTGYRNARGELVPDYDSVRIERRSET